MSRFRVMVVDDDPDIRFVVMSLLSLEFETTQASNGLDALEKIERYEPDLLLMDVNMPVMNGIACCCTIKQSEEFEHLPVIFLSASSDASVREDAMAAGAIGFFGKPFNTGELIDAIKSHFAATGAEPTQKLFSTVEIEEIDAAPLGTVPGWTFLRGAEDSSTTGDALESSGRQETVSDVEAGTKRRTFGRQRPKPMESTPPPVDPIPASAPAPAPLPEPEVALPSPPAPDYGRISRQYVQKLNERQSRESRAVPKPPMQPVAPPPAPAPPAPVPAPPSPPSRDEAPRVSSYAVPLFVPEPPPPVRPPAPPPAPPAAPPPPAPVPQQPAAAAPPPPRPAPAAPAPAPAAAKGPSAADIMAARKKAILARAGIKSESATGKSAAALKPRVLVICDYPAQLETFNDALRGIAEFLPLEDPVEAIALIARFQPDVVVMSIVERKYSGLQIAQMLKSNNRLAHIEVVFIQNTYCEPPLVSRAGQMSGNQVLRIPLMAERVRLVLSEVFQKPGFTVREKGVPYGAYVTEVIKAAEAERAKQRKHLEKQAFNDQFHTLASFMAKELKDYKEPAGFDELKGIGAKSHRVGDD